MNAALLVALGGALWLANRPAKASQAPAAILTPPRAPRTPVAPALPVPEAFPPTAPDAPIPDVLINYDPAAFESDYPQSYEPYESDYPMTDPDANVAAFLAMIRDAEGTSRASDPYRVTQGYQWEIGDLTDHPYNTGEYRASPPFSNAAGAYQFMPDTWNDLKRIGAVWDFSPESQDAGAVALLRRRSILDAVRRGDLDAALAEASKEWASLPPARYPPQKAKPREWVAERLTEYGGNFA